MIRIGIDARFMLRPLRGIPLYVLKLCQSLPAACPDVDFIFFVNKGFEHNEAPDVISERLSSVAQFNNVTIVNADHEAEFWWEQVILPGLVKEHSISLLHMPANRYAFRVRVPLVVTLHDVMEYNFLMPQKFPLNWSGNKSLRLWQFNARRRAYVNLQYRIGIRQADKIITVSNFSANDISRTLSVPRDSISTIYHGIDKQFLDVKVLPRDDRSGVFLLGGDSYQKNTAIAVKAWSRIPERLRRQHPLKIIGFKGSKDSVLMSAVNECGFRDEISIQGWVTQDEMVQAFCKAAVFIFPSRYEGFGFPLIQAMSVGTPLITTDKSSIPEVVGDVGLQFDPDDCEGMAHGLMKMLDNDLFWNEQSRVGIKRSQMFRWELSAANHIKEYMKLL